MTKTERYLGMTLQDMFDVETMLMYHYDIYAKVPSDKRGKFKIGKVKIKYDSVYTSLCEQSFVLIDFDNHNIKTCLTFDEYKKRWALTREDLEENVDGIR